MVTIPIVEEHIQTRKQIIVKNSKEKRIFVKELIEAFKDIDISDLSNIEQLENVVLSFISLIKRIWIKNSKTINITKHFKSWWDINCSRNLEKYRLTKSLEN